MKPSTTEIQKAAELLRGHVSPIGVLLQEAEQLVPDRAQRVEVLCGVLLGAMPCTGVTLEDIQKLVTAMFWAAREDLSLARPAPRSRVGRAPRKE